MTKTKELVTTDKSSWTPSQIELIKSTVAKGATDDELKLFLYIASKTGLDPLTKQVHFIKRKTRMPNGQYQDVGTTQTGIDGYRAIAERTKTLAGIDDAIYDLEDPDHHPNKASVTVYRIIGGERVPFTASARWSEYVQEFEKDEWVNNQKTGKKFKCLGAMWKKMPYLMLAKCAEALALRKAFPNDLSGLYTNEEMQQADRSEEVITYESPESSPSDSPVKALDGEIIDQQPQQEENRNSIVCPYCGNSHNGKYPKCIDCWKREKNGEKLVKQETKTLINGNEKPF